METIEDKPGLMYLIDTNVVIEGLLEQDKAKDVKKFFQKVSLHLSMT